MTVTDRRVRWTLSLAAVALMPKCGLCLGAWLALALGLRAQLCGEASPGISSGDIVTFAAAAVLGLAAVVLTVRARRTPTGAE